MNDKDDAYWKNTQILRNPNKEATGHFTGRCGRCGSKDLWDDNMAYGCNTCGEFWCFNS